MLDGTFEDKVLQVGANTSSADQVKISIKATDKDNYFLQPLRLCELKQPLLRQQPIAQSSQLQ